MYILVCMLLICFYLYVLYFFNFLIVTMGKWRKSILVLDTGQMIQTWCPKVSVIRSTYFSFFITFLKRVTFISYYQGRIQELVSVGAWLENFQKIISLLFGFFQI